MTEYIVLQICVGKPLRHFRFRFDGRRDGLRQFGCVLTGSGREFHKLGSPVVGWATQEIKDYRSKRKAVNAVLADGDVADADTVATVDGLRALFDAELQQDEAARRQRRLDAMKFNRLPAREANRELIENLDQGMRAVRLHGLSLFRKTRGIALVSNEHQEFYIAEAESVFGGTRMRACVEDTQTGESWFCLDEDVDEDCAVDEPVWHCSADFGSIGFPGLQFLKNGLNLNMTAVPDRFHQLICCWKGGQSAAGLTLKSFEYKPVVDLHFGPFGSQATHGVLVGVCKEFFETESWDGPTFSYFYDDICAADGEADPAMGSDNHRREKFAECRERLAASTQGDHLKDGRWWSKESRGMATLDCPPLLLMLLIFLGFRRGWWASFSETPLFDNTESARLRQDDGEGLLPVPHAGAHDGVVHDGEEHAGDDDHEDSPNDDVELFGDPTANRVSAKTAREIVSKEREKLKNRRIVAIRCESSFSHSIRQNLQSDVPSSASFDETVRR